MDMHFFPVVLAAIVYLIIIGFFIYLIIRFIRAHERIADSIEKLANKE